MMRGFVRARGAAFTACVAFAAHAMAASEPSQTSERYVKKIELPSNETVVVAEGDFEARSIGSYSVRLYASGAQPGDTTIYESGLLFTRDGTIEDVRPAWTIPAGPLGRHPASFSTSDL